MPTSVFVSYRRDDSKHAAGRLGERLDGHFKLFMDIDSIRPGTDFTAVVRAAVDQADVVLALIGAGWLTSADETGASRLQSPEDWVATEIGTALKLGTPVIPVLVDGARMPTRNELPTALADLASRQAITLTHESFAADCTRLIDTIEGLVAEQAPGDVDLWADPDYPAARSALLQGQWEKAIEGLEHVLRRHPRQQSVIDQLEDARRRQELIELDERARASSAAGRWGDVVAALEASHALQPSDDVAARLTEARQRLQVMDLQHDIRALANVGDWAGVIAADGELSVLDPRATDFEGLATHAHGQLLEARLEADYRLGLQQLDSERWAEAETTFGALLERRPEYRDSEALLGVARRRGEPTEAAAPAQSVVAASPRVDAEPPSAPAHPPPPPPPPEPPVTERPAPQARPSMSTRVWVVIGVAALLLVGTGIAGAVVMNGDDNARTNTSGPSASNEPSATASAILPPPATGTELVSDPNAQPAKAADTYAMAARTGGVRISHLADVEQFGTGDAARTAPDGGRLVGFRLANWDCDEAPDCKKWSALNLKVLVGSEPRPLPDTQGTYVVAVPEGTTSVDLVMKVDAISQSLSLLTGEPGPDNIAVLARPDRFVEIDDKFRLAETFTPGTDVCKDGTARSSAVRDVVVSSAQLDYFVDELDRAGPRQAYMLVDATFTRPCRPGDTFRIQAVEMKFLAAGDTVPIEALPLGRSSGPVDGAFKVPADVTGGTLLVGGTRVANVGTSNEYTVTLSERPVTFQFS